MVNDDNTIDQLMFAYDLLPFPILLIDYNAVIVASNKVANDTHIFVTKEIIGLYVGDVFGCVNTEDDVCGHTPLCTGCPIRQTINKSIQENISINSYLCNYRTKNNVNSSTSLTTIEKHVYISTSPISVDEDDYILVAVGDVTESKRLEDTLRTSLKLNGMIDTLDEGELLTYCLDEAERLLSSDMAYFHLYDYNQHTIHMKAWSSKTTKYCKTYSYEDIIFDLHDDSIWQEAIISRSPVLVNNLDAQIKHKGYPCHICPLNRMIVVPIFDGKRPVGFMSVANKSSNYDQYDIDVLNILSKNIWIYIERKLLQTKTIESNTRYDELTSRIPIGVYRYQTIPNSTITWKYMSPRFLALLGIDSSISRINPYFMESMVHPDDLSDYQKKYDLSAKGPQPFVWEGRIIAKTHVISVHVEAIPTVRSATSIIWDGIIYDISNQKELEEALRESKYKAEIAAQAKSSFLANMSHEIRTPMNAIIGFNDLLRRTDLTDKQRSYLTRSDKAAENLLAIINDILDYSKIEAGKLNIELVAFKLDEIMNHISDILGIKASNKDLEFVIDVDKDVPNHLVGDPLRLTQIIINLTNNAIKFTESGQVVLKVRQTGFSKNTTDLEIIVKDTGIGMSKREMDNLFKSFSQGDETTTRKFGGTGLGLSITKNLVELMGGTITASSQKGIGSEFIVSCTFKIDKKSKTQHTAINKTHTFKVMVVDDHEVTREVIGDYLSKFNIDPVLIHSGEEALKQIDDTYDLIILDWKLDGINGVETWHLITQKLDTPPKVIMLTSYGKEDIIHQANDYGINQIITKPVTQSILHDIVLEELGSSHIENIAQQDTVIKDIETLKHKKILLVEDNKINQQVASELLENVGITVDIANNGLEAVEKSRLKIYDLILMDLQMPVMDGYTAAIKIKIYDHYPSPIIALTADVMPDTKFKAFDSGMCAYISKPFNSNELYRTLVQVMKEHSL